MKSCSLERFYRKMHERRTPFPFDCLFELTYRCNLNCIHCYCKGLEGKEEELTTDEIKRILDEIHQAGCIWLVLTGGEPLIREDFLEIYSYAKKRGFIIILFTNGQLFNEEIIDCLIKTPPYSIEITLNGITRDTYEKITRASGSFSKVIGNIKILAKNKLPVIIKTNLLKQNKNEVVKIKRWVEGILGKPKNLHYFKYDPIIYPRLNRDKRPARFRLSSEEISEGLKEDQDMRQQYQEELHRDFSDSQGEAGCLYNCDAWMNQFFINPFGRRKFCLFSQDFSTDLRKFPFKEGFYGAVAKILKEKFKTHSKCRDCNLKPACYWCPPRAYLETGNEEDPVQYYCRLAKRISEETYKVRESH